MSKVIGTVPNINYPARKDYVVEYNRDWWIVSSTVYRSVVGIRSGNEGDLDSIVKAVEFQIAAGRLKLKHYTYEEMLNEYDEFSKKQRNIEFMVGVFSLILMLTLLFYFR